MRGPGPGPGGPRGMGGPRGIGGPRHVRPLHGPHPVMHRPRYHSYVGTGLSALIGAAIGTTIANNNSNKQSSSSNNQTNNANYYEVFSYCPNCGTKRNGNEITCNNCGTSLVK